jgi:hypothetical protein
LSKTQGTAIPPHQTKAGSHEQPGKKVGDISDGIIVTEQGKDERRQYEDCKWNPKSRAPAERLGAVDMRKKVDNS